MRSEANRIEWQTDLDTSHSLFILGGVRNMQKETLGRWMRTTNQPTPFCNVWGSLIPQPPRSAHTNARPRRTRVECRSSLVVVSTSSSPGPNMPPVFLENPPPPPRIPQSILVDSSILSQITKLRWTAGWTTGVCVVVGNVTIPPSNIIVAA